MILNGGGGEQWEKPGPAVRLPDESALHIFQQEGDQKKQEEQDAEREENAAYAAQEGVQARALEEQGRADYAYQAVAPFDVRKLHGSCLRPQPVSTPRPGIEVRYIPILASIMQISLATETISGWETSKPLTA